MLLYGAVIAVIGLICASIVAWPVMLCIALCLAGSVLALDLAKGVAPWQAALSAIGSLAIVQVSYVLGGFIASWLRSRRFEGEKKKDVKVRSSTFRPLDR